MICAEIATALVTGDQGRGSTKVLLDNQCSKSIFRNKRLLHNIRTAPSPLNFFGINSDKDGLTVNQCGEVLGFGTVYYSPHALANVLSWSQHKDDCDLEFDSSNDRFLATTASGTTYAFICEDGLYQCDFAKTRPPYRVPSAAASFPTVAENMNQFTVRQQKDAAKARELSHRLGQMPASTLSTLLPTVLNLPVTLHDVSRAEQIYGPNEAHIKGRTVRRKTPTVNTERLPRSSPTEQVLFTDIMYVEGHAFLVSVVSPLELTLVDYLGHRFKKGTRAVESLRQPLKNQISTIEKQGFVVTMMLSDGEGAISALQSESTVPLNPAGAGSHVPKIERKIREIKEYCRAILHSLPYDLPGALIQYLVYFAVSRINLVPHVNGPSSVPPREAFLGIKTDFNKDIRFGFGDYVQATDMYSNNTMEERTTSAIALCPVGNREGTGKFYKLSSGKTISANNFTILPTPDLVIAQLNALARATRSDPTKPLEFFFGDNLIEGPDSHLGVENTDLNDRILSHQDDTVIRADELDEDPDIIHEETLADLQDLNLVFDPERFTSESASEPDTQAANIDDQVDSHQSTEEQEAAAAPDINPNPTSSIPDRRSNRQRYNTHQLSNIPSNRKVHFDHRYSARAQLPDHKIFSYNIVHCFNISVKQALDKDPDKALSAIFKELSQLVAKKVWLPASEELKKRKKAIRSFMFLKDKFRADGSFDKLKARLVAGGNMQDRTALLYEVISSPTASVPALFLVAAIAAQERRHVVTADITGAFLNADISHQEILMELDPIMSAILLKIDPSYNSHLGPNGCIKVVLKKALYGCIESSKLWFDLLSATLMQAGFVRNAVEECVFNKTTSTGEQITVVIYVDDLFITCKNKDAIDDLIALLESKFESVTSNHGTKHSYLGMVWDFDTDGQVKVSMEGYVEDLLKLAGTTSSVSTPAADELFKVRDAPKLDKKTSESFHTLTAKLLYLAKRTRPDILLAVSFLTTRVSSPDTDDWSKLQRCLKYLHGTRHIGIIFRAASGILSIEAFIDAAYGVHSDGKSHSGMVIMLSFGPFLAKSTKQRLVTRSSTEAEIVAFSDNCSPVIWSRDFLIAQGYDMPPAKVYQDNMSSMALELRGASKSDKTRHVNIRYFWVKDRIDNNEISVEYKPTDEMIADVLTKPLQGKKFTDLRDKLLNYSFLVQSVPQ